MSEQTPRDGFDSLYGTLRPALVTIDELVAPWADLKIDLPREAIVRITFNSFLQLALALDYVGKLIEITGLATYDADGVPTTMTEVLQWQPVPARTDDELLRDAMEWVANLAPVAAEPEEEPDDDVDGTYFSRRVFTAFRYGPKPIAVAILPPDDPLSPARLKERKRGSAAWRRRNRRAAKKGQELTRELSRGGHLGEIDGPRGGRGSGDPPPALREGTALVASCGPNAIREREDRERVRSRPRRQAGTFGSKPTLADRPLPDAAVPPSGDHRERSWRPHRRGPYEERRSALFGHRPTRSLQGADRQALVRDGKAPPMKRPDRPSVATLRKLLSDIARRYEVRRRYLFLAWPGRHGEAVPAPLRARYAFAAEAYAMGATYADVGALLGTTLTTASRLVRLHAEIAEAAKGVMGALPLRIEVSREGFDQLRRAIEHEIVTDVPKFGVLPRAAPMGAVDVRVLPNAPPGLWRVVYHCPDCGPGVSLATPRPIACPTCRGTHEVFREG
ncbi:hypothetical protein OUZ56_032619 [Daphnia magna]|uniref:Uncharacterized protein n=1 Tax=Daphnia magna TaxID=35525 RepID=A0ABR0B9F3_9CRUS|nr:hypothetical protein OUZ56_032619 [Daphnia magna]